MFTREFRIFHPTRAEQNREPNIQPEAPKCKFRYSILRVKTFGVFQRGHEYLSAVQYQKAGLRQVASDGPTT